MEITKLAGSPRFVDAKHHGVWELPVLGEVAAPAGECPIALELTRT